MTLYLRCILEEPDPSDGLRISVMSRHTMSNGITADPRIQPFDIHMPILAPSPKLIGDYYHRDLSWQDFERRYLEGLQKENKIRVLELWAKFAKKSDITFLCVEPTAEKCHRRLLAEECQRRVPGLKIVYR